MKPMTLEQVRQAAGAQWISRPLMRGPKCDQLTIRAVSTDSRQAAREALFVAVRGQQFDGHAFLMQASQAGCVAAMVQREATLAPEAVARFSGALVGADDTVEALGRLAKFHRRTCRAVVIGVTGSNGKTTVKRMIHHVLSKSLRGTCSPKSFNNQLGVPLTLLECQEHDQYVICEIGTSAPGEIAALAAIAQPDIAVITSIGPTHLEKLGGVEQVAVEKAGILRELGNGGLGIVTADSPELEQVLRREKSPLVRFGMHPEAQLRLTGYQGNAAGCRFELNGRWWAELKVPGRHNALNALAAIAVAQRLGITQEDAAAALADYEGVEMRLQTVDLGPVRLVNDAYNANPASMLAAADVLADLPGTRKVMVVGDMRELGDQARRWHLQTGGELAARAIDLVVGVGRLGRYLAVGARDAGLPAVAVEDLDQAVAELAGWLQSGDVVLLKGSRAMGMERMIEPLRAALAASARSGGA